MGGVCPEVNISDLVNAYYRQHFGKPVFGKINRQKCVKNWQIEIHNVDSVLYYHKVYFYIANRQYTDLPVTGQATLQRTQPALVGIHIPINSTIRELLRVSYLHIFKRSVIYTNHLRRISPVSSIYNSLYYNNACNLGQL